MNSREVDIKFKFEIKKRKSELQRNYLEETDENIKQEILKQIQIICSIEISSSGLWGIADTNIPDEMKK